MQGVRVGVAPTDPDRWHVRCPILAVAAVLLALLWLPGDGTAHSYRHGDVQIGHVWAPPADGDTAAVYMPLLARGAPDRLVAASSPAAERVRFRRVENGRIEWLDEIALEPGRPLGLAEWREHLWLDGLTRPLRRGDRVPLVLRFAEAGEIEVEIHVETAPGH
jgi:periplasmic copper chaperone A